MHYYKRNIGDYAKKAGRLSILQHGVYNLLIDACYDREKFPTREEASDWVWASTPEEEQALDFVLRKFFRLENGVYVQNRIAEEVAEYQEFCREQAEKGKRGGRPKKKTGGNEEKPSGLEKKPDGKPDESKRGPEKTLTTNQEPLTTNHQPKESAADAPPPHVDDVFDYWCLVMNKHPPVKLTTKREACIRARLREGYSVDQLKQAIDGCARSDHHMGKNDSGTVYDDLTLICRSGDKVEFFIKNVAKFKGVSNGNRKESIAEQSWRQTEEIYADIEAREARERAMGADAPVVWPQVGQSGGSG